MAQLKSYNDLICIGWVPTDKNGNVFQATVSNAYNHMFDKKKRSPVRKAVRKIYGTENKAASYSPVGVSRPVFMEP